MKLFIDEWRQGWHRSLSAEATPTRDRMMLEGFVLLAELLQQQIDLLEAKKPGGEKLQIDIACEAIKETGRFVKDRVEQLSLSHEEEQKKRAGRLLAAWRVVEDEFNE